MNVFYVICNITATFRNILFSLFFFPFTSSISVNKYCYCCCCWFDACRHKYLSKIAHFLINISPKIVPKKKWNNEKVNREMYMIIACSYSCVYPFDHHCWMSALLFIHLHNKCMSCVCLLLPRNFTKRIKKKITNFFFSHFLCSFLFNSSQFANDKI